MITSLKGPTPGLTESVTGITSGTKGALESIASDLSQIDVTITTGLAYEVGETITFSGGAYALVIPVPVEAEVATEGEEAESTVDTISSSSSILPPATFVVENGTGLSTANSYASTEEADQYHADYGAPAVWDESTVEQKQEALRTASRALDAMFLGRWLGVRISQAQALAWPRYDVEDIEGFLISSSAVPREVKAATAVLALLVRSGVDLLPDDLESTSIRRETKKIAGMEHTVEYVGGATEQRTYTLVERLTKHLVQAGYSMWRS